MSFRHVYNRNKEEHRITERAHTGAHALARAYLDAARDLGVVEQPNRALDLLREGGDARTPKSKHFHGSWFRIAKQKSAFGFGEDGVSVTRRLCRQRRGGKRDVALYDRENDPPFLSLPLPPERARLSPSVQSHQRYQQASPVMNNYTQWVAITTGVTVQFIPKI